MKPYTVKIMGDELSVFSKSEAAFDKEDCPDGSVLIEPSFEYDFFLNIYNEKYRKINAYSSAASAADFLLFRRGLPLDEISFFVGGRTITVYNRKKGVLSVEVPKCKFKFTKLPDFMGAPINLFYSDAAEDVFFLEVKNTCDFDAALAPTILLKELQRGGGALIVFSRSDGICYAKSFVSHLEYPPYQLDIAAYLAAYLMFRGVSLNRMILNEFEVILERFDSMAILSFSAETENPYHQ